MTKLTHSLGAKIGCVALWSIAMLGCIGGAVAIACMREMGFYGSGEIYWPFGYEFADGSFEYYGMISEGAQPLSSWLFYFCQTFRYILIVVALVAAVAAVFLLTFLMCSAGHQPGKEEVVANGIDRIPLDIFAAAMTALVFLLMGVQRDLYWSIGPLGIIVVTGIWIIVYSLLLLLCLMTVATRFKLGTLWKNTVIYRVLWMIWRVFYGIGRGFVEIGRALPILWKTVILLVAISFVECFVMLLCEPDNGALVLWWGMEKLVLIPLILRTVLYMKKLQAGGRELAAGHLDYRVDVSRMYWDFKKHGENLNSISDGMNKAVEAKMKSERFKTELITNVSHDIKTPLTSIINYVDLIKKQEPENEAIAEYIEVLDRQSKRLKKLIEDLVEASKASTGNVTVDMQPTSVGVVLTQAAGEYDDRMSGRHLELILNQPQEEIMIMADGRLLWRVFDNLLSNICKYAQGGTRVYLNLDKMSGKAVITFRNISAYPLNMTSDELLERFTRGDSSRHTEGSGLGLSIAKSLTELQKGDMNLYTDGDLFKVVLMFDQMPEVKR